MGTKDTSTYDDLRYVNNQELNFVICLIPLYLHYVEFIKYCDTSAIFQIKWFNAFQCVQARACMCEVKLLNI